MKFVFVGGCGRSGTSLLQDLLCRHDQIAGGAEFNFTKRIMLFKRIMQQDFYKERNTAYYDDQRLDEIYRQFYASFFKLLKEQNPEAQYLSEKTPNNIDVIDDLLTLFPDSKFLFVLRDGRDVAASYQEVYKRAPQRFNRSGFSIKTIASTWNGALYQRNGLSEDQKKRVHSIRYEELTANPESVMKNVLDFLRLPIPETPLHELPTEDVIHVDNVFYTDGQRNQALSSSRIGSWKKRLNILKRMEANVRMAHHLEAEGYAVDGVYKTLNRIFRQ